MISKHLSCKSTVNCLFPRTPGGPPISWLTWIQLGICITLQTLVRNDFNHASGESRTVNRTFAFGCIFIKSSKMQIIGKSRVDLNWPASIVLMKFYRGDELDSIRTSSRGALFPSKYWFHSYTRLWMKTSFLRFRTSSEQRWKTTMWLQKLRVRGFLTAMTEIQSEPFPFIW